MKIKLGVLLILLFLSIKNYAQQKIDSTFNEQYLDNTFQWGEWETHETVAKIKNGQYAIQHLRLEGSWAYWQAFQVDLTQDFIIETQMTQQEGADNYGHGVIWGYADWDNYNSFLISPNGYVNVNATNASTYKELQAWKKDDAVKGIGLANTLKIERIKNDITFYVNEKEVFKSNSNSFKTGGQYIGFILYRNKKVDVDYLTIKGKFPKINLVADAIKGYKIENLGPNVNTDYAELLPVISPDGKTLYFTRRNDPENIGSKNDDVLYSEKQADGTWGKFNRMSKPINNTGHNFVVSVAADNNTLILGNTYNADGSQKSSGLSISYKTTQGWSVPEDLNIKNFYNKAEYNEYCLSPDNQFLILAIQRDDSKAGSRDLYVSFKNGKTSYTEPLNLGDVINTHGTEMTPFLASDSKTLYFSSNGHAGYGNNDIFVTRRLDDTWKKWSTPENLGPEINSRAWDAYFTIPASGEEAYLVSSNNKAATGDIVKIKLTEASKPNPVVLVKGKVLNKKDNTPLEATIHYYEMGNEDQEVGSATSNPVNGNYNIILQAGKKYSFRAAKDNYYAINDFVDVSQLKNYIEIEKNLYLAPIEIGQTIRLNNIFFDFDKANLKPESYEELDRLVNFLKENKKIEIEISGHTDNQGSEEYNLKLSQLRAESVLSYITSKGIDKIRLTAKGFGKSKPVASNEHEEGRAQNRRVEFTILKQ